MGKEKELTTYKADLLDDLRDPEYAAIYLETALEGGSPEQFLLALRDVAEARKISSIAQASNLNRENLYKMLSVNGNPRLKSLTAILDSAGLRLSVVGALASTLPTAPPLGASAPQIALEPNGPRRASTLNPRDTTSKSQEPGNGLVAGAYNSFVICRSTMEINARLVGAPQAP